MRKPAVKNPAKVVDIPTHGETKPTVRKRSRPDVPQFGSAGKMRLRDVIDALCADGFVGQEERDVLASLCF